MENVNQKVIALYHLGVLKALHEQGLLPRIISGHAVGAMVAALICIHTDEELPVSSVCVLIGKGANYPGLVGNFAT